MIDLTGFLTRLLADELARNRYSYIKSNAPDIGAWLKWIEAPEPQVIYKKTPPSSPPSSGEGSGVAQGTKPDAQPKTITTPQIPEVNEHDLTLNLVPDYLPTGVEESPVDEITGLMLEQFVPKKKEPEKKPEEKTEKKPKEDIWKGQTREVITPKTREFDLQQYLDEINKYREEELKKYKSKDVIDEGIRVYMKNLAIDDEKIRDWLANHKEVFGEDPEKAYARLVLYSALKHSNEDPKKVYDWFTQNWGTKLSPDEIFEVFRMAGKEWW